MTRDKPLFVEPNLIASSLKHITFGDNNKGKVIGLGKVAISRISPLMIFYLFNLLDSILCQLASYVIQACQFYSLYPNIVSSWPLTIPSSLRELERVIFILWISLRVPQSKLVCLQKQPKDGCGTEYLVHAGMSNLQTLMKKNHLHRIPDVKFDKDHLCGSREAGKLAKKHHSSKDVITTNMSQTYI